MRRAGLTPDLLIRALLVVAAAAVSATGASRPLSGVLAALATVAVVERLVRLRRRGRLDAVLVGVGGLLVTLVLLGLVLDVVPGGLTRRSWSVGLGVIGLLVLGWCRRRPAPPLLSRRARPRPVTAGWSVAAIGLTVLAVVISVVSANNGESRPLQLSAQDVSAGQAQVVVRGGSAAGRYELLTGTGAAQRLLRGPFDLAAGASLATTVRLAAGTRLRVELATVSPRTSVRFVILDNTGR